MASLQNNSARLEDLLPVIQSYLADGKAVRFSPKGTSMLPMLRQDVDSVELHAVNGTLRKYDLPLYRRDNGQFVLHRIVRVGDNYTCVGDNQFDLERGIRHDQMIGVVRAFYRKDRRILTTNIFYIIYCRFWHYSRGWRHLWRRGKGWLRRHLRRKKG